MAKRALLIGINYFDTQSELNGCHNDVDSMHKLLLSTFGYRPSEILVLKDVKGDKHHRDTMSPTRRNILVNLHQLIAKTKPGDELFIHYSGHGTWTWDRNGDEKDRKDELICPVDNSVIRDDELYANLVRRCPPGARIRCVFDCCHSGTMLDLPCRWRYWDKVYNENRNTLLKGTDIMMISGCRDNQTSADAWIKGEYAGALTWAFVECINGQKNLKGFSWKDLVYNIRYRLKAGKYDQVPQLSFVDKKQMKEDVDL
jgi:metacaspase-1